MKSIAFIAVLACLTISCHHGMPFRPHHQSDIVYSNISSVINSNPFINKIEGNRIWIHKSDWASMSSAEKHKIFYVLGGFIHEGMIEIVDPITGKTYDLIKNIWIA